MMVFAVLFIILLILMSFLNMIFFFFWLLEFLNMIFDMHVRYYLTMLF